MRMLGKRMDTCIGLLAFSLWDVASTLPAENRQIV
jgi:hypothetical protein